MVEHGIQRFEVRFFMRITKTSVILIPLSHEVKLGALVFVSDVIVDTATFFPLSFDRQHFTQLTSA